MCKKFEFEVSAAMQALFMNKKTLAYFLIFCYHADFDSQIKNVCVFGI